MANSNFNSARKVFVAVDESLVMSISSIYKRRMMGTSSVWRVNKKGLA